MRVQLYPACKVRMSTRTGDVIRRTCVDGPVRGFLLASIDEA